MLSISSSSNSKLNQILQTQPRKSNLAFVQLHGNSPTDFRASVRPDLALNMPGKLTPFGCPCCVPPFPRYQYFSAAFCINSNYTHEWGIFIWSDRISGHYAAPSAPDSPRLVCPWATINIRQPFGDTHCCLYPALQRHSSGFA